MSKNFKKTISALLAGIMMATSCSIAALADDPAATEAPAEAAAATEAPAATEVPETFNGADVPEDEKDAENLATDAPEEAPDAAEATEAPAAGKGYDNDKYYQAAIRLCTSLGIITGYDDGSIKPESQVTRAEMATIVLRMLQSSMDSTYQNVFNDVSADHWAASTIQSAVEQGIVDGMGDGTFLPDGSVKYEQVIKMVVAAMGYGTDAERSGGYPNGYISVGGGTLNLLKSVNGQVGKDLERGEVIKVVYNALLAPVRVMVGIENGLPKYEAEDTLGVEKFNLYEEQGVLTATPTMTISTADNKREGIVVIDGVDYKCSFDVNEFLATKVKFYYIDDNADIPEIVAMVSAGKSAEVKFDAEDIDEINTTDGQLTAYTSKTSTSTKRYKIKDATVVYNGTVLTPAEYAASGNTKSYDDFINPKIGTVRLADYDDDGTYDIVFVESYQTMVVTTASTEKLSGKIENVPVTLTYDLDDSDYEITVTKNGSAATVKNLKKNDVASIRRNIDDSIIDIVVTGETITGEITATGTDEDYVTATINGQVYKVDKAAEADVKLGTSATFYLDAFNVIGYLGDAETSTEKYAMIANVYYNDEGDLIIRLFDNEGKTIEAQPASGMKFWAPGAKQETSKPSDEELYNILSDDDNFIKANGNSAPNTTPVKVCKYRLNASGEITRLYCAVDQAEVSDTDAMRVYVNKSGTNSGYASLNGVSAIGGAVAGYFINDGITEFTVPNAKEDRTSTANYLTGSVTASQYKVTDGGTTTVFVIGDFKNERYPQVLLKYTTSASAAPSITDLDTASSAPTFMLSKINEAVDAEGETIFELVGYSGGSEVKYTTASNTALYEISGYGSSRTYDGELIYDATKNSASTFTNAVETGDIFAVKVENGNAVILAKMYDAGEIAKAAVTTDVSGVKNFAPAGASFNIGTRDSYFAGFISNVDVEDSAFISMTDFASTEGTVTYDVSTAFSDVVLTVNADGRILNAEIDKDGGLEASELMPYGDDPNEFDFGVFKLFKGNMGAGYIIRVQIEN